jgi:LPS O-antigen subunit length determinant protein (WzzB/FepE family)
MDMKRIVLLPLFAILFSCGGTSNKFENTISDYVQTNNRGTKLDMNFKAEKLDEVRHVTVADSIKIITENFNAEKDKQMASLEKSVSLFAENIEKAKAASRPSHTMINSYQSSIDKTKERIDALKASVPEELAKYENRDASEILTIVVRCTYSIDEPITNKRATETFDFFLSPDGTKCYSQKRVK